MNLLRITLDPFGNFSPQQIKRIIGDLKLRFIPRPALKTICKLPTGYIGETGTDCTQVLEVVVGAGVHAKEDRGKLVRFSYEGCELVHNEVECSLSWS